MNASEPLMMCRKHKVMSKPGGSRYPGISSGGDLLTARAASGMKVASVRFRARVRNPGTCRLDAKGAIQAAEPQGSEYRCEAQGRNDS